MAVAFHRGLSEALRMRMQMTGIRMEEIDAQRALAGWLVVDAQTGKPIGEGNKNDKTLKSGAAKWMRDTVEEVLSEHLTLTREWEENNPGKKPFPDMFVEVVLAMVMQIDPENPMETINQLKELAETELEFG